MCSATHVTGIRTRWPRAKGRILLAWAIERVFEDGQGLLQVRQPSDGDALHLPKGRRPRKVSRHEYKFRRLQDISGARQRMVDGGAGSPVF